MSHAGMHANRIGLGITVALHAAVLAAVLSYAPARKALLAASPIMVDLITPPKVEVKPELKPTELPKPKPVSRRTPRPEQPAPVLAVPAEAPSAAPPVPEPPRVAAPQPAAAPAAEPVVPVIPPVFNADYLDNPAPAYPALSRRLGEHGKVVLRVLVNASGAADEVQLRSSSGHARLDEVARDTVRRWKFVPAKRGSEAVAAWVLIPISFRLEG